MGTGTLLAIAMALDGLLGEPRAIWQRVPHPAVLMGRLVSILEQRLNGGTRKRAKGILALLVLLLCAALTGLLLAQLGALVEVMVAAVLLAQRSLVEHASAVANGLRQSLPAGRRAVSLIVSRDTSEMDESAVSRAAIESAAENLSDGVIAPAFWFLIGGLPGILIYKIVNTADSMIGYRTDRYREFGWASARFDDLLNFIPARLTAALIALGFGLLGKWQEIATEARLHKSPNAGWPEAATARAIDVALAGPRAYDGQMQPFAWVNGGARRDIGPTDIDAACGLLWRTWGLALGIALLIGLVLN